MEREEIEKEYRRLAKKADNRLRALESYQYDKNFAPATHWAYAAAQRDIRSWGGSRRFNTSVSDLSDNQLQAKIADINKFLESKTSTKTGIRSVYMDRVNTLNSRMGTNYTWQEFAQMIKSDTYQKLESIYGSKTAMTVISKAKKKKQIAKDMDKAKETFAPIERQALDDLMEWGWFDE